MRPKGDIVQVLPASDWYVLMNEETASPFVLNGEECAFNYLIPVAAWALVKYQNPSAQEVLPMIPSFSGLEIIEGNGLAHFPGGVSGPLKEITRNVHVCGGDMLTV